MRSSLVVISIVVGLLLAACGISNPPAPRRQHPVASRTGPACDSIVARLASGDSTVVVHGPFPTTVSMLPEHRPSDLPRKFGIRFSVDQTGRAIVDTLTLPWTRSSQFRAELLNRLRAFRFDPAIVDGCAVPADMEMRFEVA
jgi:hypothetical protein